MEDTIICHNCGTEVNAKTYDKNAGLCDPCFKDWEFQEQEQFEQVDRLVEKLQEAGCEVGWSDLKNLAIEILSEDATDSNYIAGRFEVSEEMAVKIIRVVNLFNAMDSIPEPEYTEDGQEDQNWLGAIRKIMKPAYLEASEVAVDYLNIHDIEELDSGNDFKDKFTPDQQKALNTISTVLWQTMIAALEQEGIYNEEWDDSNAFNAIWQQIGIAHFG